MKTKKSFSDIYSFPGFRARSTFSKGILGDSRARIVKLERRQKKQFVQLAANPPTLTTISASIEFEILPAEIYEFIWNSNTAESTVKAVRP